MATKSDLIKELEALKKKRKEEAELRYLKTQIWVEKHPTLVGIGEKTRRGIGVIGEKTRTALKKMKEKELKQKEENKKHPQESYADRINKVVENLAK